MCIGCGRQFVVCRSSGQKHCTVECFRSHQRDVQSRECEVCKKKLRMRSDERPNRYLTRKTCGNECRRRHQSLVMRRSDAVDLARHIGVHRETVGKKLQLGWSRSKIANYFSVRKVEKRRAAAGAVSKVRAARAGALRRRRRIAKELANTRNCVACGRPLKLRPSSGIAALRRRRYCNRRCQAAGRCKVRVVLGRQYGTFTALESAARGSSCVNCVCRCGLKGRRLASDLVRADRPPRCVMCARADRTKRWDVFGVPLTSDQIESLLGKKSWYSRIHRAKGDVGKALCGKAGTMPPG